MLLADAIHGLRLILVQASKLKVRFTSAPMFKIGTALRDQGQVSGVIPR